MNFLLFSLLMSVVWVWNRGMVLVLVFCMIRFLSCLEVEVVLVKTHNFTFILSFDGVEVRLIGFLWS